MIYFAVYHAHRYFNVLKCLCLGLDYPTGMAKIANSQNPGPRTRQEAAQEPLRTFTAWKKTHQLIEVYQKPLQRLLATRGYVVLQTPLSTAIKELDAQKFLGNRNCSSIVQGQVIFSIYALAHYLKLLCCAPSFFFITGR